MNLKALKPKSEIINRENKLCEQYVTENSLKMYIWRHTHTYIYIYIYIDVDISEGFPL